MFKKLKAPLAAMLLSSVAVVPAATISYVATADVAIAKSDKAGGNGNGNGGKSKSGSSKGKSGFKASSSSGGGSKSRGGGGAIGKFFNKLTGQDKKAERAASASGTGKANGKLVAEKHPSEWGNMNGPLHANINAVLAHIRNGNTNGRIGEFAALAVANHNLAAALLAAGEYTTVEEYEAAVADARELARDPAIEEALAALADGEPQNDEDAITTLSNAGYPTTPDDPEQTLEDAQGVYDALLDDAEAAARDEDVEAAIPAQDEAEKTLHASWNKNDDNPEEVSEEEQDLINALNARLAGHEDAIAEAVASTEVAEAAVCEGEEPCDEGEGAVE